MLDNFLQILPEVIFDAAEKLGGRCTGRFYALHALENRVYDIEMEEGPHVIIKFYRPGPRERRHDSGRARFSEGPRRKRNSRRLPAHGRQGTKYFRNSRSDVHHLPEASGATRAGTDHGTAHAPGKVHGSPS